MIGRRTELEKQQFQLRDVQKALGEFDPLGEQLAHLGIVNSRFDDARVLDGEFKLTGQQIERVPRARA
ncbi:hypothetical protein CO669_01455 [Bradyrhizobium sp. Y36]|nr:hypothetical protein CO669_01455 [Bradyrhizobium sp. Y36]